MPIVFGGVLISFLVLFGVLGLIALHRASLPLVRGLFGGWAEQRGFRRWFLRAIGLDALANAIAWVVHRVRQAAQQLDCLCRGRTPKSRSTARDGPGDCGAVEMRVIALQFLEPARELYTPPVQGVSVLLADHAPDLLDSRANLTIRRLG